MTFLQPFGFRFTFFNGIFAIAISFYLSEVSLICKCYLLRLKVEKRKSNFELATLLLQQPANPHHVTNLLFLLYHEFEKWCSIRARVGGVSGVLAWLTCQRGWPVWVYDVLQLVALVTYFHEQRIVVDVVDSVLLWVEWVVSLPVLHGLDGQRTSMGSLLERANVGGML